MAYKLNYKFLYNSKQNYIYIFTMQDHGIRSNTLLTYLKEKST